MIFEKKGNILKAKTQAIVNPVNIMGVMGAGLALQIKKKYPVVFESYKQACFNKSIVEKGYHICRIGNNKGPEYIINIPTKHHYRELSSYRIIIENIITLKKIIDEYKIQSISIPALGCGLGGLDWEKVKTIIVLELSELITQVYVYSPGRVNNGNI